MTSSTNVSANVPFSCMKTVYMDRSIEKSLAEGVSTKKDISLIREFVNERRAAAGISLSRQIRSLILSSGGCVFHQDLVCRTKRDLQGIYWYCGPVSTVDPLASEIYAGPSLLYQRTLSFPSDGLSLVFSSWATSSLSLFSAHRLI